MSRRPFVVKKYSQARQAWPVAEREAGQEIGHVSTTAGARSPYTATTPAGVSRTEQTRYMACYWLWSRWHTDQES